ncbi:DUF1294 domain-containing protein [Flavobacterium sp.]|uniref:DUF1294 domain-containing protein n=1 Tax=Flavobacterium sp. TaxID=239 RepID=UPI002B4AEBE2|nr:DUF1294 domain-containing protein [Flavobacterium sp.]
MNELFYYFLAVNILSFSITGIDKWYAVRQKFRVSEKILLVFVLIGGTIGSAIAMLLFRHKISKLSYLSKFFAVVLLQIAVFYFIKRY